MVTWLNKNIAASCPVLLSRFSGKWISVLTLFECLKCLRLSSSQQQTFFWWHYWLSILHDGRNISTSLVCVYVCVCLCVCVCVCVYVCVCVACITCMQMTFTFMGITCFHHLPSVGLSMTCFQDSAVFLFTAALHLTQPWWGRNSQPLRLHFSVCLHQLPATASPSVSSLMATRSSVPAGGHCVLVRHFIHLPPGAYLRGQSPGPAVRWAVEWTDWWNEVHPSGWFPGAARDFSPRVSCQCRPSNGVCTPLWAIACIYICEHVKDPVLLVRVWLIIETLKHPACTLGWVAWLSQLACPGEGSLNFSWEKSHWNNTIVKSIKKFC